MSTGCGKGSLGSLSNFNFDLGTGSTQQSKSLKEQKYQSSHSYSSFPAATQQKKPSWSHQPAVGSLSRNLTAQNGMSGPSSMVGDISGKSWSSSCSSFDAKVGEKSHNLFGELVNTALNKDPKGNTNAPLQNQTSGSAPLKSWPGVGGGGGTLNHGGGGGGSGGTLNHGGVGGGGILNHGGVGGGIGNQTRSNIGGPLMKSMGGGSTKDPFGSLVDFGSKQEHGDANKSQNTSKLQNGLSSLNDPSNLNTVSQLNTQTAAMERGGEGDNLFGMLFSSTVGPTSNESRKIQDDDWGFGSEFGSDGGGSGGGPIDLEGLPPPPTGLTPSIAKNKGSESQKQGQYPDAIKWFSWAFLLLQKSKDQHLLMEVLASRASCYKEIGECKKAVADLSEVLEHDHANTAVLVQRALLYEGMEKHKLGAEDLRSVLRIDPTNKIARSTIHRLTQMAS